MKKIIFITIVIVLVALIITFLSTDFFKNKNNPQTKTVCFNHYCYNVELADTQKEREDGLMNRQSLDKDKGMLFIFPVQSKYSFWMKDTLIPLDIIWINSDKKVVEITTMQPCKVENCPTYDPTQSASYVLELNANTTKEINLKIGDKLTFNL